MTTLSLQRVAAAWCVLMALALAVVQIVGPERPPFVLFVVFAGVWLFGAAMLLRQPTFGAVGTALYGIILGVQVLQMHGTTTLNLLLAGGSLVGSALAIAFLLSRRRRRGTVVT